MSKLKKANIGSGYRPLKQESNDDQEWYDIDVRSDVNPNIIADVRKIPVKDEFFDEVLVHSVLEHFDKWEMRDCLKEWTRILKKDGKIIISVPDMERIAIDLSKCKAEAKVYSLINLIYGERNYPENAHKWGFTEDSLVRLLQEFEYDDFKRLKSERYPQELLLTATKL